MTPWFPPGPLDFAVVSLCVHVGGGGGFRIGEIFFFTDPIFFQPVTGKSEIYITFISSNGYKPDPGEIM